MLKIAFGMIVFEGDYVLEQCLRSVYPYASQILIAEGPVKFWQDEGKVTSEDMTNKILESFPDPENKITIVHGQYSEKDDQCKAYMSHLNDDIDYVWNLDSDEIFKNEDIEKIIKILEEEKYTSVGVKSCSFYGGFDRIIGGFEEKKGNFLRIFKVYPGSTWLTHRPPTVVHKESAEVLPDKHLDSETLYFKHGVRMYHYSYVFPNQVKNKIQYYKAKVSRENCIDDYFNTVYLPWMTSDIDKKFEIEINNMGVHEFKKEVRPSTFTRKFIGSHPRSIQEDIDVLESRIHKELKEILEK